MQRAEVVLGALRKRAESRPDMVFLRLYRHLYNPDLYVKTKTSTRDIQKVIALLRTESYYPGRTPGCQCDALVEHALAQLIAAVFGLDLGSPDDRQGRALALRALSKAAGVRWALVGNLEGTLGEMDTHMLARVLGTRIQDGRVLELSRRIFQTRGWRGSLGAVFRQLCLERFDRLARGHREIVAYARWGTSFMAVGKERLDGLHEAVSGFLQTHLVPGAGAAQLRLVDMAWERPVFLGYQLAAGPGGCRLLVPAQVLKERLWGFVRENRSIHRPDRVGLGVERIVGLYRQELVQLFRDYALAHDGQRQLSRFRHYHFGSLLKTLARKEQASARAVMEKYRVVQEGKSTIGVRVATGLVVYPVVAPGCISS
ncbi:MAG: hypothetical protein AB1445_08275 [Bacillota bacterium]